MEKTSMNLVRSILYVVLILFVSAGLIYPVFAGSYLEYKNEYSMKSWDKTGVVDHLRFGYKAKNNLYVEGGYMTGGYSWETGYKFKVTDKVTLKGKLENKNRDGTSKSKIETEIRFNF
jgi:hypothetical protein|tara:strand:+ start:1775 stop:2128 length:354 start_codon:yes stop_codon:yes gene_type:complete